MSKNKAIGPIPPGFTARNGILQIAGHSATDLVAEYGSPLFVYSLDMLRDRLQSLRDAMPTGIHVHYAMKANPFAPLLRAMTTMVDGIDIASGGELTLALEAGANPNRISFAGPGKRDSELEQAICAGITVNLESPNETNRALSIGDRLGIAPRLAIRVNPDFDLKGSGMRMGGGSKPFGMDIELVVPEIRKILAAGAQWHGFHIFAGSQSLDTDAIIETQRLTLALAARLANAAEHVPPHVNLGGGFGIPYFPGDTPVNIKRVGLALASAIADRPDSLIGTQFAIELGRYLVGEAGVYLTTILDRKVSRGEIYLVTDGGLHHQLAASGNFGTVIKRNYPAAIASRFLVEPTETVSIVGCLCTPLDRLCDSAEMPRSDVGDIAAVFCAGGYGASASPAGFLGHGPAREVLITRR